MVFICSAQICMLHTLLYVSGYSGQQSWTLNSNIFTLNFRISSFHVSLVSLACLHSRCLHSTVFNLACTLRETWRAFLSFFLFMGFPFQVSACVMTHIFIPEEKEQLLLITRAARQKVGPSFRLQAAPQAALLSSLPVCFEATHLG